MNKLAKRLSIFFIGIPVIFLVVYCDWMVHLPLNFLFVLFATLGANEFCNMLKVSNKKSFSKPVILTMVMLLPLLAYVFAVLSISLDITPWIFLIEIISLMGIESFFSKSFEASIEKIANSALVIFYCGFFMTFLSRLTIVSYSKYIITLFLIYVFMCDSCAWFFGMLFGKNNRGFFAASPNKSKIGFLGGIAGSVFFGVVFWYLFKNSFDAKLSNVIILAVITSVASIIGDLIESVFKRSCNVKDSGVLMPGRGGVLDSIDSVLIAAPVFYIGHHFLF